MWLYIRMQWYMHYLTLHSQGGLNITSLNLTNIDIVSLSGRPVIQVNGPVSIEGTLTISLTEPEWSASSCHKRNRNRRDLH